MNAAQVHLSLNHLPIVTLLIGIATLGIGLYLRALQVYQVGLWLFVTAALMAIPVYLTGDPAETVVKNYPGVIRSAIHEHEEAAEFALAAMEIIGLVSLVTLSFLHRRKTVPKKIWALVIILSLATLMIFLRTAHLGGLIRHEEIQN